MRYKVVLKSLDKADEKIVLAECYSKPHAEQSRRLWRRALGTRWTVDRRPGLDTLEHLALTIEEVK